jgi:hypothetical protein
VKSGSRDKKEKKPNLNSLRKNIEDKISSIKEHCGSPSLAKDLESITLES